MWSFWSAGFGSYYFTESWEVALDSAHSTHKLPKPLVTDLDGDGLNEIVVVTHDYKLMVLDNAANSGSTPQPLKVKAETTLIRTTGVRSGRKPVGLGSGYLQSPEANTQRKQVIVVVTDGWTVLCFSSNLKLEWESTPVDEVAHGMYHEEVAILAVPYPVRVGDLGAVVVGGRLAYGNKATNINHEHTETDHKEAEEHEGVTDSQHFSYYAFDGKTGKLRWKHEDFDFYPTDTHESERSNGHEEDLLPHHSFKQHVFSQVKHLGEVDWRQYKGNIFDHLPYRYLDKFDAAFNLDRFVKKSSTGGRPGVAWASEVTGVQNLAEEEERSSKPNVIVAKLKTGLEIIHLYTGRPLCRLLLPPLHTETTRGAYADINRDGIIDQILSVTGNIPSDPLPLCYATAQTGVPIIDQLWNGTTCGSGGAPALEFFMSKGLQSFSVGAAGIAAQNMKTTAPVFCTSLSHSGLNSIFYVSTGQLTCYNPSGRLLWQSDTSAWWNSPSNPALTPLHIEIADMNSSDFILVVGDENMGLVSTDNGDIVATHPLSETIQSKNVAAKNFISVSPPVIGDFNNDGLNDIILLSQRGLHGYAIQQGAGSMLFPIIILTLMVVITYLLVQHEHSSMQNRANPTRKRALD
jgi:outer membrane protein assembly factor BamB